MCCPGFFIFLLASWKHSSGGMPIAWKLKSNRVSSPSHTVECFTEVMIRHGFLGRTNCASSRLKLTNQWQAACLQYCQYCGLRHCVHTTSRKIQSRMGIDRDQRETFVAIGHKCTD